MKKFRKRDNITVWRCSCGASQTCPAILMTETKGSGEVERVNVTEHSHEPHVEAIAAAFADSALRQAAVDTPYEAVQNLVADTVNGTPVLHHVSLN